MGVAIVVAIIVLIVAAIIIKKAKDRREEQEAAYYASINEKEELGEIQTPSGKNVFESSYTQYDAYRRTSKHYLVVIAIAIVVLVLSIIAGIVAAVGYASMGDEYYATAATICAGCVLEGVVIFGILYGIAHIVKNTDETRQETMEINRKIDNISEE